jgi:hypothetical protein
MARNRLADETSPYLRQHADNPVHWLPWGEEAFAEARERDVPILLSVGYSACHWCHVMAHESFEDDGTAAVMNDRFVNVKVDREERPDVDAIYMEAVQAMTGHGGWPMTVFLDHEGRPFYGGTYFPPTRRGAMPSFTELLRAVDDAWRTKRDDIVSQAGRLTEAIASTTEQLRAADELPGREVLDLALTQLHRQFDPEWGGFGGAPKFPQTMSLELLLRAHRRSGAPEPLAMVERSLDAMAAGGVHDHLGGGFARYSVDRVWLVPHFEKMLYDQALLARAYLHGWQVTGRDDHRRVLEGIVGYVLRDLRHPDGGFFSAEDADSEGVEGKFYVWDAAEIDEVAGADAATVRAWFGVTDEGNFEGANILHRPELGDLDAPPEVERVRDALFERRERRVRPGLDDKVLTEWNALMLATLAEAAAVTGRDDWLGAAVANAEFLLGHLQGDDGRWRRSWQAGDGDRPAQARHLAYAADHAALVDAFTRLAEATGEARWIDEARGVADALIEQYWDVERGGLYTTGRDADPLVTRRPGVPPPRCPHRRRPADRPRRGRPAPARPARRPAPHRLRPPARRARPGPVRPGGAGGGGRPPRPGGHRPPRPPPRAGGGLGRALRLAAVGRSRRRPGLRVPALRLPAARHRRRHPARAARRRRPAVSPVRPGRGRPEGCEPPARRHGGGGHAG